MNEQQGGDCAGTDVLRTARALNAGWTFDSVRIWTRGPTRATPSVLEECGSDPQVLVPVSVLNAAGQATLPSISLAWSACASAPAPGAARSW